MVRWRDRTSSWTFIEGWICQILRNSSTCASGGAGFILIAIYLLVSGRRTFSQGIGLGSIGEHKLEIHGHGFEVSTVATSVGGLMIIAGIIFGFISYLSLPTYEVALGDGLKKVTEAPLPRSGMLAYTASGKSLTIDAITSVTRLDNIWKPTDATSLKKNCGTKVGEAILNDYATELGADPNTAVVVDYGGNPSKLTFDDPLTKTWTEALKSAGVPEDRIVVLPAPVGATKMAPSISIVTTGGAKLE